MAYASKVGRARVSAKSPQALAVCQRCALWYNRVDLNWQFEWRGPTLQNIYILVCRRCLDVPQEQLRSIVLPADPVPVYWPLVEDFAAAETNYRSIIPGAPEQFLTTDSGESLLTDAGVNLVVGSSGPAPMDSKTGIPIPSTTLRITQNCENRITQPVGRPMGYIQDAVMPYNGGIQKAFGTPLTLLSVTTNGTATVSVTCSKAHGLVTDSQISAEGLSSAAACGIFSVNVLTAMAFTYDTGHDLKAASLLESHTRIITALMGLPIGSSQVPQVGV